MTAENEKVLNEETKPDTLKIVNEPEINVSNLNTDPISSEPTETNQLSETAKLNLNTTSPVNITYPNQEENKEAEKVLDLNTASETINNQESVASSVDVEPIKIVESAEEQPVINNFDLPVPNAEEVVLEENKENIDNWESNVEVVEQPVTEPKEEVKTDIPVIPVETVEVEEPKQEASVNSWEFPKEELKTDIPVIPVETTPTIEVSEEENAIHEPVVPEIKEVISNLKPFESSNNDEIEKQDIEEPKEEQTAEKIDEDIWKL